MVIEINSGYESAQKMCKLIDENEIDFDENGLPVCYHCREYLEYPYDEPHNCIECAHCGERDMCICSDSDVIQEVCCEHCAHPCLYCKCLTCDDCGQLVYDCGCEDEEDYQNDLYE